MRHLVVVECGRHDITHKEQPGLGMVDNLINLVGLELMLYGHGYGTIGEGGKESAGPC